MMSVYHLVHHDFHKQPFCLIQQLLPKNKSSPVCWAQPAMALQECQERIIMFVSENAIYQKNLELIQMVIIQDKKKCMLWET